MADLSNLPDDARLWLFAADGAIGTPAQHDLVAAVRAFTASWKSHGRPVAAGAELLHGRVLAVAGAITPAEVNAGVSGCGIDAMTRAVETAAESAGVRWASALDVCYLAGADWQVAPRPEFRRMAREGQVTPETVVLDLTPDTLGALRDAGAARPAGAAWHGVAFWSAVA